MEPKPEPTPQLISSETLKALYIDYLEVRSARLELAEQVQNLEGAFRDRYSKTLSDAGIKPEEWNINLREGTLTRKDG